MSTITKEKNILVIVGDKTNRRYTFDINTGILYGCSGKALKTRPTEVRKISSDLPVCYVYACLIDRYSPEELRSREYNIKYLAFADTLTALGYTMKDINSYSLKTFSDEIFYGRETLKDVLKFFKEEKEAENRIEWSRYCSVKAEKKLAEILKNYELSTEEINTIKFIVQRKNVEIKISVLVSYLKFLVPYYDNDNYSIERVLMRYLGYCKDLNYEPKKGDFASLYVQVKQTYELNKAKIESEKLVKNQPKTLFFEDENFTVIIPTTSEEFRKEAEAQSNCVYRSYLSEVISGYTNIVFIRKKSAIENSYITCEVRKGDIVQYLGKYNNYIRDGEAIEFRKKYQAYLNTIQF